MCRKPRWWPTSLHTGSSPHGYTSHAFHIKAANSYGFVVQNYTIEIFTLRSSRTSRPVIKIIRTVGTNRGLDSLAQKHQWSILQIQILRK